MNYYPFHIGDYVSATRHLSWEEDAAFRRLLDTYYTSEKPFPVDHRAVCRLVLATTDSQREAVKVVLDEFFVLTDSGWINRRADAEIATMRERQEKQRDRANKRWHMPRANAENATAMPRHAESDAAASENDAGAMPPVPVPVPVKEEKKERETRSRGSRLPTDWLLPDDWAQWACRERPDIDCRRTAAGFADYWHGKAGSSAVKVDWEATWRNWVRNERPVVQAKTPADRRSQFMAGILEGSKRSEVVNVETYEPPAKRLG